MIRSFVGGPLTFGSFQEQAKALTAAAAKGEVEPDGGGGGGQVEADGAAPPTPHALSAGQATWMAEEHQLKHAERMPASNIVAVPSCEARPPQRRRSRIKRCATPALPVKYAGSLVESARQTF